MVTCNNNFVTQLATSYDANSAATATIMSNNGWAAWLFQQHQVESHQNLSSGLLLFKGGRGVDPDHELYKLFNNKEYMPRCMQSKIREMTDGFQQYEHLYIPLRTMPRCMQSKIREMTDGYLQYEHLYIPLRTTEC